MKNSHRHITTAEDFFEMWSRNRNNIIWILDEDLDLEGILFKNHRFKTLQFILKAGKATKIKNWTIEKRNPFENFNGQIYGIHFENLDFRGESLLGNSTSGTGIISMCYFDFKRSQ